MTARPCVLALGLLPVLALACFSADRRLYEVELTGQVALGPGFDGPGRVHLEVHHARTGDGPLARPLALIDAFELDGPGPFTERVLVPLDEGDGLVVYAWHDRDGDGHLCALGAPPEPAALIEVVDFPAHQVSLALLLDAPCAGPEALVP